MKALKIGIVEDELLTAKSIFIKLQKIGYEPLKPVRTYNDALKMIQSESPDLLLLDIILEGDADGIDLAETINREFGIPFIFLTANSDEATVNRAKKVKPYAYLVKPFNEHELFSSIEIAFNNFNELPKNNTEQKSKLIHRDFLFIKQDHVFHKVRLADILYVMSEHVYLNIFTEVKTYVLRSKMDDFLDNIGVTDLVRVHRSYTVNIEKVDTVHENFVKIGVHEIPLSKNYKVDFIKLINAVK